MPNRAPRLPWRPLRGSARGALHAWCLWLAVLVLAAPASAGPALSIRDVPPHCIAEITGAHYEGPTTRYAHGVLGDAVEWGRLTVGVRNTGAGPKGDAGAGSCRWGARQISVTLPDSLVFEDTAPRLADLDGDGLHEILTVEASLTQGARLSVWGVTDSGFARLAATPFIGTRFRWLAPVAAADLDGDGAMEIAYVDRPHLAKVLRVWRYEADGPRLTQVASADGFSNHRIGEDFISGGLRDCGGGPEMILADGSWRRVMAARLNEGRVTARVLGAFTGPESFATALACQD